MVCALPSGIMNYPVSASSPTEDLLTLGRILSEAGDYASTVLDREHLSLAKKCSTKLRKVAGELISRKCIQSAEDLYAMTEGDLVREDLSTLTVGELYNLYRRWPLRHQARAESGREHLTCYYEGRIVRELQRRKAAGKGEQLKIDYCTITYRNGLDNLSFILSTPLDTGRDRLLPEAGKAYTPSELVALINLYSHYRDIAEWELLIEYTDMALELLETAPDKSQLMELASVVLEAGRRKIIAVPSWVSDFLAEAVAVSRHNPAVPKTQMVLPLLTLHLHNGNPETEREAARIINRCYRETAEAVSHITSVMHPDLSELNDTIASLYIAVMYCTYVRRYNVRKMAACWNDLCSCIFSGRINHNAQISPNCRDNQPTQPTQNNRNTQINLTVSEIIRLLSVAGEIERFTEISPALKASLLTLLEHRAGPDKSVPGNSIPDTIEARAYLKTVPACMAAAV